MAKLTLEGQEVATKRCTKCDQTKPYGEFSNDRSRPDGLSWYCKKCHRERVRAWKEDNPERVRNAWLQHTFNISSADYDRMLSDQNGCCAICEIDGCPSARRFAVDHDHACCPGKKSCGDCIRGLLCMRCNQAVGLLNDSYETVLRAAEYVKQGPRQPWPS